MAILTTTIICPTCRHQAVETMPLDRCVIVYECAACKTVLRPKTGDCCVFCSYGTERCPPMMGDLSSLPIACTLSPDDLRRRLALIQTLTRESLRSYKRDGLDLVLLYAPVAAARVKEMVTGEQQCCGFLAFNIHESHEGVHVTIRAPESAREAADELFSQFTSQADAALNR